MGFFDIISALGALAIIILVLVATYYGTRWYARRMGGAIGGKHIKMLDRAHLGGNSYLAIVQVGGCYYLIGVSEKNMELICELADFDPPNPTDSPTKGLPFGQIFSDLLEKAKGKKEKGDE